jgi:two-component system nitrogen regulation sensor histidine kinase GlnL
VKRRGPAPAEVAVPWPDVLASLSDAVLVADRRTELVALNPAAETLLESSREHILGRRLAEIFGAPALAWLLDLAERTLRDGRLRRRADATWETRQHVHDLQVTVAPIHDTTGALWGVAIVLHDVSAAPGLSTDKHASARLTSLGTTVLGLAHEIRNPLSGIKGAAELLGRDLEPEQRARCVDVITHEVDRLNRLVSDLSTLGDPPTLRLEPLNVHRILSNVLALEEESAAWGAVQLRTNFDPSLPPVLGDPDRLTQLFLNLVRNALEALGGTGVLEVSSHLETGLHVRRRDGLARLVSIRITDDGPGIPPEIAADIFTPLFTTKARGSGLGLAVSHQIATAHGGGLAYEARPGGGSIFLVRLPLAGASNAET